MSRLTITLSEARYRTLKEASAQCDKTIGQSTDESLHFYGIKLSEGARHLVRRARMRSQLTEAQVAEYRTVLVRPTLRKLHGLTVSEVDAVLTDLAQNATLLGPVQAPSAPGPGDQMLWECSRSGPTW